MGARPLARVIQEHIKKPLADEVLFGKLQNGGTVRVLLEVGEATGTQKLVFRYLSRERGEDTAAAAGAQGSAACGRRRWRCQAPAAQEARPGDHPQAGTGLNFRSRSLSPFKGESRASNCDLRQPQRPPAVRPAAARR